VSYLTRAGAYKNDPTKLEKMRWYMVAYPEFSSALFDPITDAVPDDAAIADRAWR